MTNADKMGIISIIAAIALFIFIISIIAKIISALKETKNEEMKELSYKRNSNQMNELERLGKDFENYLKTYGNPHTIIVINQDGITQYSSSMGIPFRVIIKNSADTGGKEMKNDKPYSDRKVIAPKGILPIMDIINQHNLIASKDNPLFVDYELANECKNDKAWHICNKCGKCGRKFDKGFMVNNGGTTIKDGEE